LTFVKTISRVLIGENMNPNEYIKNVLKTESNNFDAIKSRLEPTSIRLLHAFIGMATESAEAVDMLKKHLFYGKPLDKVNAVEEISDQLWYIAVALDALGVSFEEVMEKNIAKLKKRYGDKFTSEAALNRDLTAERKILEG
jgi:NTP pyrophosphatase (non-canonical NTP hydrolase)